MNANPLRTGFVMEQVLGHVSHYQTLRNVVDGDASIHPYWVEVTYAGNGRLERLPRVPRGISGTLRGFLQVREGLRQRPLDALLFHTQKPAVFQWDLLARTPSVLSLDVTPRQYDELGVYYDHVADGKGVVAMAKHWVNRRTFGLAKRIVVWSSWVKDSLVADYGVRAERVKVIPPAWICGSGLRGRATDGRPCRASSSSAATSKGRAASCCSTGSASTVVAAVSSTS